MAHAQKPDLVFQRNRRVHLNWKGGGGAVQSTTGSRGVRISGSIGSNAGYTMFWGRVQEYWLPTPIACFPFTSPIVRHRVPSGFNWAIQTLNPWTTMKVVEMGCLTDNVSPCHNCRLYVLHYWINLWHKRGLYFQLQRKYGSVTTNMKAQILKPILKVIRISEQYVNSSAEIRWSKREPE